MSAPLRFPWGADEPRREVAPSAFRPRATARKDRLKRAHASRSVPRPRDGAATLTGLSRAAALTAASTRLSTRPATVHASREAARDRVPGRVVQGPQRERHEPDYLLLLAAVALSAMGILMVYSSLGVIYDLETGSAFGAISAQLGWALCGALALVVAMRIDYRYWRRFSVLGMAIAVTTLVLVLMPPIPPFIEPIDAYGATRWLQIGGLPTFHPAELAKLALVVFMAHWLATRGADLRSVRRGLLPFLVIIGLMAGLVIMEPDLGTTGVLVLSAFAMFFVAGGNVLHLLMVVPLGIAAVAGVLAMNPYQMARWTTFLDPFAQAADSGYQTVQGLYALALGGVVGQGLGQSRQPGGLPLPAAWNDFIFAVVGQELGFLGAVAVIGLFLLLTWRGIRIAMQAPDTFGGLLALGITAWLGFQAFINIGVVVVLLPLTGMPLPFLSDGGSSLVVTLAAVGILLSISRETPPRGPSDAHPHRGRWYRRPHLPRLGRGVAADRPAA